VSRVDAKEAEQVFRQYLDTLAAGDMLGAAKFLADPARKSQEMGAAVLGKGAVIDKVGICGRNQCGSGKRNW